MIEVENVTKKYGQTNVLQNVSLNIEKGKITSFIGPNGAGKTTLLGVISRLIKHESGKILIEGKEIGDWNSVELAKKISILKQSNFLSVRLTIRDLVSFGRFPYSQGNLKKEDWRFVEQAIEYLKLTEIQDKYLDELSGGQRQRAFIAMVVAQNTEYVLLDEPLNNLDMKHSSEMMKTLRNLTDELGKTVVLVLHDINFASVYSDKIIALKNGELAAQGTIREMIREDVLKEIFDIDFRIEEIGSQRICIYY
jgi:iron complex transport system ATP-binding protein